MGANMLLALACVFFVMASLFESLLYPLVVMGTVPFASLGVFWLMMATGTPFNMMAMIGMVILIGIVVNNGIVLVDHINGRRKAGLDLDAAILAGGMLVFAIIGVISRNSVSPHWARVASAAKPIQTAR